MEERKHAKLSKGLLDMKFMKKTKERVEKEEDDAEGQAMYSSEITEEMKQSGNINFSQVSIVGCKDLIEGRLSFKGMNPEIEKLMNDEYAKKLDEAEKRKEKDVTDTEMAKGYSTLVDTMDKKFQNKKQRNTNKKKFLKPADY
ncbi:hypothetical protein ILUMI_24818 [Ignelater luminosus]|uniref:M-phase phosphoprotein 6 n=1 Tax=Ignelater luminosus TaxID=2038154 RepID=A0A8K0C5N2_IGNLU|nr:hypothetical protein ILUMI_24818 [Ignelater luminosus]